MKTLRLLLACTVLGWIPLAHAAPSTDVIKTKATEAMAAFKEGRYGELADDTLPAMVEAMGGRDKMIDAMKTAMQQMDTQGIKIVSTEIGDAVPPVAAGSNLYSYVPTVLTMTSPQVKITAKSFLLAFSSDGGATWKFADGTGLNPEMLKKFVPDMPAGLKLPAKEQPTITKLQ